MKCFSHALMIGLFLISTQALAVASDNLTFSTPSSSASSSLDSSSPPSPSSPSASAVNTAALTSHSGLAAINPPQVVTEVDLKKYQGLWYEIAKIPNKFQKHCTYGTTAQYEILNDLKVKVINSCFNEKNSLITAEGRALSDNKTPAKIKVTFVNVLGFWVFSFSGDYWIIGLDTNNYQWAIVGHPERKFAWILSRSPDLNTLDIPYLQNVLVKQGYSPCDLILTPHSPSQKEALPFCSL